VEGDCHREMSHFIIALIMLILDGVRGGPQPFKQHQMTVRYVLFPEPEVILVQ